MRALRVGAADPDHVTLRHAARTLVVGLAVFVVLGWVLDRPDAAPAGLFAVYCLGAQADFVGSPGRRALRYLLVGTVSMLMLPLGACVEEWPVAVVALTGVVVFTTMFLAALGGPFYAARFAIVVALLLSVTTESSVDLVTQRTLGWLLGTVAITAAALVLWPARAPSAVPELTADVCRRAAGILRGPAGGTKAARRALLDASHRLHVAAMAEHLHPGAIALDERRWSEVVHATERLAAATALLAPDAPDAPDDGELLAASARTLDACAIAIARVRPGVPAPPAAPAAAPLEPALAAALDADGPVLADALLADATDPDAAIAAGLAATDTRAVTRTAIVVAALVDDILGAEIADVDVLAADEKAADRPEEALHAQLRLRSLWFRNALRAAVALMVAVGIVLEGVGSGHGFWVALGAFTVLRADFGTVTRSARTAVVGTTIGFALSSVVVLWGEHTEIVVWVAFAAGIFVAAYGSRFRPEVGTAAFTVFVVSMYTLTEPAGLRTGEVRLLDVTIGASVTLLVTFMLWPRAGRAPAQVVAEVVDRARRSLADAVARRPVGEPYALVTDLDRIFDVITTSAPQALSDRERARIMLTVAFTTNVAEFLGHPRESAPVPLARAARLPAAWDALVDDAARVDGALGTLVARLRGSPPPPLPAPPDAVVGVVTRALTAGTVDDAGALSAAVRAAAVLRRVHQFAAAPVGARLARRRAGSPAAQPTRTGTSE